MEPDCEGKQMLARLKTGEHLYLPDLADSDSPSPFSLSPLCSNDRLISWRQLFTDGFASHLRNQPSLPRKVWDAYVALREGHESWPSFAYLKDFLRLATYLMTGLFAPLTDLVRFEKVLKHITNNDASRIKLIDFNITIPAAFIGFAIAMDSDSHGGRGVNSRLDTYSFLTRLLDLGVEKQKINGFLSPLCANMTFLGETGRKNDSLVTNVCTAGVERAMRWQQMLGLSHYLDRPDFRCRWCALDSSPHSVIYIPPSVLCRFVAHNDLQLLEKCLEGQFEQLQNLAYKYPIIEIISIQPMLDRVRVRAVETAIQPLSPASDSQMCDRSICPWTQVVKYIRRFSDSTFQALHRSIETCLNRDSVALEDSAVQTLRDLRDMDLEGLAARQALLYQIFGETIAEHEMLGVGMDIDHDPWQVSFIREGWRRKQPSPIKGNGVGLGVPFLYARKPELHVADGQSIDDAYRSKFHSHRDRTKYLGSLWLRQEWLVG